MGKITIRYKNRFQKYFIYFGIVWLSVGGTMIILKEGSWISYLYVLVGAVHLLFYFYYNSKQYLTIQNGMITKNDMLLSKSIPLKDIKKIKYFAGDYTLFTDNQQLTINTYSIDKRSLEELKNILSGLNAKIKVIVPN